MEEFEAQKKQENVELRRKLKELSSRTESQAMEIDLLKEAKQQLSKVKGKPQKIIDELNQQIERDIQEITSLREQLQRKRSK
jgi:hypothetical protein